MRPNREFDEVLIVNPFDPRSNSQQNTFMRFHEAPDMGYYAEPPEMGYYGYAEPPAEFAYYGEPPELGYYGYAEPPPDFGYYGEPPEFGYYGYAEPPDAYGWYGEPPDMAGYAEPIEYYAEEMPMPGYGYAQMPEMVGYGEYEPLGEDYPAVAGYGEPYMEGYVRETRHPTYNPGCPIATNINGYEESMPIEGYTRPATVNPACETFTPQPAASAALPPTFAPLW
jgi:hypothetical protein